MAAGSTASGWWADAAREQNGATLDSFEVIIHDDVANGAEIIWLLKKQWREKGVSALWQR